MKFYLLLFVIFINIQFLNAQDPNRFKEEITNLKKKIKLDSRSDITIFTGSSSIRMWDNLKSDCPNMNLVNTGFGGSHMSDLLYYIEETIINFKPHTIYIYEGDNDISSGKTTAEILLTAKEVVNRILSTLSKTQIYFISAKPSPSRWQFEKQYIEFNNQLRLFCENYEQVEFIDVWYPMINENGKPIPKIFISDSLHMNNDGYKIWQQVICK